MRLCVGMWVCGYVGMAKKTKSAETLVGAVARAMPDGRVNPADTRRGIVSMHAVLTDVQTCRDILAYIEATAKLAIDRGAVSLETDGVTQLDAARKLLGTASGHLAKAYLSDVASRRPHSETHTVTDTE